MAIYTFIFIYHSVYEDVNSAISRVVTIYMTFFVEFYKIEWKSREILLISIANPKKVKFRARNTWSTDDLSLYTFQGVFPI